ncbi:uncharacterized protein At4g18490 [Andrographis paniculata]|uniref:uncharacterized protein At4g18490 n=1 Tax=Andrographis paniculata TaxID=175694 RepID=UPI0021E870A6|nr:uncharacterized protein At4g18490 [Andrographis paniculata]
MEKSEKRDSNLKEKNLLLVKSVWREVGYSCAEILSDILLIDMDIEKDFLSSWKSMSVAEDDTMDFDLPKVSKGNKKPFDFDKADMDFNLDVDFGKISSFNIDMLDIEISPPLQQAGKSKDNLDEPSSGEDKGKINRFAFAFDFDEMENFNFDSSSTKVGSKAKKDTVNEERSPDGTMGLDKEVSMKLDLIRDTNSVEKVPQKSSLPETEVDFDMEFLVGRMKDVDNPNLPPRLAVDDPVTSVNSAAGNEVASDKTNCPLQTSTALEEQLKSNQSEKLDNSKPVDLEVFSGNDGNREYSSDYHFNKEQSNSSGVQQKLGCIGNNATGSDIGQDTQRMSLIGLTNSKNQTNPENLQHCQAVGIAENNSCEKNEVVVNDNAVEIREGIKPGHVNSNTDLPSPVEDQEIAAKNLKLSLVSQPKEMLVKETLKRREPLVTCLRSFLQSKKLECPMKKMGSQNVFLLSGSQKMDSTDPTTVEGRESDGIQSARKLASLPLQRDNSKALLKKDIPQTQIHENYKGLKTLGEIKANGLQNGNQPPDSFPAQNKDIAKPKSALMQREITTKDLKSLREVKANELPDGNQSSLKQNKDTEKSKSSVNQREMTTKDLDALGSTKDISNEAVQKGRNPTALTSFQATKCTPAEEQKHSSIESGKNSKKPPELRVLKLPSLNLDTTKSPIHKNIRPGSNIRENTILTTKTPSSKKVPCCLSVKRKSSEKNDAHTLPPSKRPSPSPRLLVKTPETIHDNELLSHNEDENSSIKNAAEHCEISTFQMSFATETVSNIMLAESYGKELDDLCNMLRKKHDEAKELLVRAIVNNNKLLMLNSPVFEVKIVATRELFAKLALDSIHVGNHQQLDPSLPI